MRLSITAPQVVAGTVAIAVLAAAARLIWLSGEPSFATTNKSAIERMLKGMSAKPSGTFDRDFAVAMIPHHQGAIDMAIAELRHGTNERLRRIAQAIVVDQQQEIAAMRLVLDQELEPTGSYLALSSPCGTAPSGGALFTKSTPSQSTP